MIPRRLARIWIQGRAVTDDDEGSIWSGGHGGEKVSVVVAQDLNKVYQISPHENSPNRMISSRWKSRLFVVLCVGLSMASVRADKKLPAGLAGTPIVKAQKATVKRGEVVAITLEASSVSTGDVLFILRDRPLYGKFLDDIPKRLTRHKVVVRYQSDANAKGTMESLRIEAKLEGGNVSPSEKLVISIVDSRAALKLPEVVDVGPIRLGQVGSAVVEVKNVGDAEYSQDLILPKGWTRLEGAKLVIPAGGTTQIKLEFAAKEIGRVEAPLIFGNDPKSKTLLRATCERPIDLPDSVSLSWDEANMQRSANIPLVNPTGEMMILSLNSADASLQHPRELKLDALKESNLPLIVTGDLSKAFSAALSIQALGHTHQLRVVGAPAPAVIKIHGLNVQGKLDFGSIAAKEVPTTTRTLELSNLGGEPAAVYGSPTDSFILSGMSLPLTLLPGTTVKIIVSIRSDGVGKLQDEIDWSWKNNHLKFAITADVQREHATSVLNVGKPGGSETPATAGGNSTTLRDEDFQFSDRPMSVIHSGLLSPDIKLDRSVPQVSNVYQKSYTDSTVTVAWHLLPDASYDYVILRRTIATSNGDPVVVWLPMPPHLISYQKTATEGTATLKGLPPGWRNAIRVTTKSREGGYSQPTNPIICFVPLAAPINWTLYLLIAAGVALVGIWIWWHRRNAPLPMKYTARSDSETFSTFS